MVSTTTAKSYQQRVVIESDLSPTFNALTREIDKWWGKVNRPTKGINDVFKVSFGEAYWVFKITAFQVDELVAWECIESNQVHAGLKGIKEEWLGTILQWELNVLPSKQTQVNFIHEGLVPSFNCYRICSDAWDFFITNSLKSYLETGVGKPE